jgi:hypothetical protein
VIVVPNGNEATHARRSAQLADHAKLLGKRSDQL